MAFPLPTFTATILCLLSGLATVSAQSHNADGCSCYRTNESSVGYFTSHRFLDYRNASPAPSSVPSIISNPKSATDAYATSDFFLGDAWTSFWTTQKFNNSETRHSTDATTMMVNSPNNVYIEKSQDNDPSYSTYLTLRTVRLEDFQSAAEIDSSEKNFQFLSARFSARVIGSPGACAGMFTYLAGDTPQDVQEADIEILTQGPRNMVQYTNQPSVDTNGAEVPEATVNGTNPGDKDWTHWHVYRVDWMPGTTTWYVDGAKVARIDFQAPKDPAGLMVNMWSDGGSWTGNMSLHDQAYLQLQWIELAYNTSGPYEGSGARRRSEDSGSGVALVKRKDTPGCKAVCSIDEEIDTIGTPALLWNNTSIAPVGWKGQGSGCLSWIPFLLVSAAVFGYF